MDRVSQLWRVVYTVLIIGGVLCFGSILVGVFERAPRSYNGTQKFSTLSEAIVFQTALANEAKDVGAEVETLELTQQSPPTVHWSVLMPATKYSILGDDSAPFKYGSQYQSRASARNSNIAAFIFFPLTGIAGIFIMWNRRVQEWMGRG